jgi:hypothetical protein
MFLVYTMIATGDLYHFILKLCKVISLLVGTKVLGVVLQMNIFSMIKMCFSLLLPLSSFGENIAWALPYSYEDAPIFPNL